MSFVTRAALKSLRTMSRSQWPRSGQTLLEVPRAGHPSRAPERGMRMWQVDTLRLMWHRGRDHDVLDMAPKHRSEWQEWNYRSELFGFSQRLKENISESGLKVAFTDVSHIKQEEQRRKELGITDIELNIEDNSGLADFGAEVIASYSKPYLRQFLPKLPEEGIRAVCDFLLSDQSMAHTSKCLGTTDLILCENLSPTHPILAKVLKAVVGVLAKEQGRKHTEKFVLDFIITYLQDKDMFEIWDIPDSKASLNRILANESLPAYEPRLLRETGRNTIEACFMVGLYVNREIIGYASGETLDIAEEMAAFDALRRLFGIRPAEVLFKFGSRGYDLDLTAAHAEHKSLDKWTTSGNAKIIEKRDKMRI